MESKEKLILSLKILRAVIAAVIDVIEIELDRKTERNLNETWFEENSKDNPYSY